MNKNIDALSVMEQAACALRIDARHEQGEEMEIARAAVAELIEACENLQQHPDDVQTQADFCSALARIRGAA